MHLGSISMVSVAAALALLAGCNHGRSRAPSIGQAYAGPIELKIRSDIPLESSPVATVKHGDRLEILQRRRRFLRVRTAGGAEGWTDERQLLGAEDMASLKDLSTRAAGMPAQGQAVSYGSLNMHTLPARQSPSFLQIKEKEKVDVLTHVVTPRTDISRKPLIPPSQKKAKPAPKKPAKEAKYPPPPMPKPPGPPANWMELSKTELDEEAPSEDDPVEKPVATDEWSLVRTAGGNSGWVLTRRLVMAIPDEVAQYAEGRRIVSYFQLGTVLDGGEKKPIWLWTTTRDSSQPWDFDSFRVFIWSLRRHRYETAYIERTVKGYAPVRLLEVDFAGGSSGKAGAAAAKYPGFSICLEKNDGQRYRREYALLTNVVRFAGERACEAPAPPLIEMTKAAVPVVAAAPAPPPERPPSFAQRMKERLRAIGRSWFGK